MTNNENVLPEQIGPYRISKQLGEGGMAVVYLAEQSEPVKRNVALKILKSGMDSKQIVARFESERQALAVLEHPNIAKIFDGGVTRGGRPYFAMEYVDGLPINEFCDTHRLNTEARLKLFIKVCRAVQHAHLKGLIHRDLKPSNILVGIVDAEPQPLVIDFGIAKATEETQAEATRVTRVGQFVGTPHYMSPEQTGSTDGDIDTRSDIYSLGVLLYELLVGALPIDLTTVRDIVIANVIQEKIPPKPSVRYTSLGETRDDVASTRGTNPQQLSRHLKGDLDWIVMQSIEKDRERRYQTANALADDCERYLNRQPIVARPPSAGYLLSRFVRRNRAAVAGVSIAFVAVLIGAMASTVGFLRATEAEQEALREAETAQEVSSFLVGLFETSDPAEAQGENVSAREVLDRGVATIDEKLIDQPEVKAALQTTMGSVYRNLGLLAEAEVLFRDSLKSRTRLLGNDHPDTLETANWLAIVVLEQGRLDEVEVMDADILERRRRVLGDRHPDTLKSIHNLAVYYWFSSRLAEAEPYFREALEASREVLGNEDIFTLLVAMNYGAVLTEMGRYDQAQVLLDEAAETQTRVHGIEHPQSLQALERLANLYLYLQRFDEAESLFEKVLDGRRRILGDGNAQTLWSMDRLATLYKDQGRYVDAEPLQREAAEGLARVYGNEHPDALAATNNLAELYRAQGRFEEAEPLYEEILETQMRLRPDDMGTAFTSHNLACVYRDTGRYKLAEPLFAHTERVFSEVLEPGHPYILENYTQWAALKRKAGDESGASELEARIAEFSQ